MKHHKLEISDTVDDLVEECFNDVINSADLYPHFVHAAILSIEKGQNAIMWVELSESLMKAELIHNPDQRIHSDKFILLLAGKLSEHFCKHMKN